MKTVDYLIIGGGVAGTTAAETLRQNDKNCSIAIVSDEPYRLYSRILLSKPYFFFGKIPFENIWLKKEEWYKENNIELIGGKSAVQLDRPSKNIKLDDGTEIQYGKLLLAVGGHARRWNVPGADKKGVCYLRVMDEMKDMMDAFKGAKHGVTIGSGFVSFETVELMRKAGLEASVVMLEPYFWYPLFDEISGKMIEAAMEKEGVKLLHKSEVAEVTGGEKVEGVTLKDGTKLPCEAIGVGIGLQYNFEWLKTAGITINRGINADEFLKTNDENIFTAGDCAEFNDLVLRERVMLGNWSNALTQGSVAAANMLGQNKPFKLVSYYTAQAFGLNIAMVGDVRVEEGKKVIARRNEEKNSYVRIIAKGGKVEGATLLNCTEELFAISALIEKDIDVTGKEKELSDPKFDLKSLTLSYVA
jgi:NAD(P)H-nitrite reductase large subunit